ncbi:MAG: retropepsin-like aspartic protease [bacterium]|nr:retropepsin-like aspartic protease [bacterium]
MEAAAPAGRVVIYSPPRRGVPMRWRSVAGRSRRQPLRRCADGLFVGMLALCLANAAIAAGAEPPVLLANSAAVDVRDGDRFQEGVWVVDPAVALDVYAALRTTAAKHVTFITDVDSLSFDVQPGRTYDFTVLLGGRDSCRTRISTMMQTYGRLGPRTAGPDTIPISIKKGKLNVVGTINGSGPLNLIFDTGAECGALYPSALDKGAELRLDGTTINAGTGGSTERRTASDNRLDIAGLRWDHEPLIAVERQADRADGIVGWPLFLGKVVELDYDRMIMIVHDELPAKSAGYARTAMPYVGPLTAVEVVLVAGEKREGGLFILDTAGTGTMIVNQAFSAAHGLHGAMRVLGKSTSRGVGSGVIRNEVVLVPELVIAGFSLPDVPVHLELPAAGNQAPPGGVLCLEVLARFNTILDYRRQEAYFQPNSRFDLPFGRRTRGAPWPVVFGVALSIVAVILGVVLTRARRRPPADPSARAR